MVIIQQITLIFWILKMFFCGLNIWLSSSRFEEAKTNVHWFVRAFCPLPSFAMHEGDWTKICQTRGGGELDKCPSTMKYHHHDHPKATADQYMVLATPTIEYKAGDACRTGGRLQGHFRPRKLQLSFGVEDRDNGGKWWNRFPHAPSRGTKPRSSWPAMKSFRN